MQGDQLPHAAATATPSPPSQTILSLNCESKVHSSFLKRLPVRQGLVAPVLNWVMKLLSQREVGSYLLQILCLPVPRLIPPTPMPHGLLRRAVSSSVAYFKVFLP